MFIRIEKSNKYINLDSVLNISFDAHTITFNMANGRDIYVASSDLNKNMMESIEIIDKAIKLSNLSKCPEMMNIPNGIRQAAWEELGDYVCDIPRL